MKKLIVSVVAILLFVVGLQCNAFAASTSGALEESTYTYELKNLYGNDFNAPFLQADSDHGVSTTDLSLNITENLVSLPGKNGLDFVYNLTYRSARKQYEVRLGRDWIAVEYRKLYTYTYSKNGVPYSVQMWCPLESQVLDQYSVDNTYLSGEFRMQHGYLDDPANAGVGSNVLTLDRNAPLAPPIRVELWNERGYYAGNTPLFYDGWMAELPNMTIKSISNDDEQWTGSFVDEKGAVMNYEMTKQFGWDPNGTPNNSYRITGLQIKGTLSTYTLLPIDGYITTGVTHNKGFSYNLRFMDEEGKIYYVYIDTNGGDIRAIEDRYGNMITYQHTAQECLVTDTYGRQIRIEKLKDFNAGAARVLIVEGNNETELVRCERRSINNDSVDDPLDEWFSTDNQYEMEIIRREDDAAQAGVSDNSVTYISSKVEWLYDNAIKFGNASFHIDRVEYPTGASREYTLAYGREDANHDAVYRVSHSNDISGGQAVNGTNYSLTGENEYHVPHSLASYYNILVTRGVSSQSYIYDNRGRLSSVTNNNTGESTGYSYGGSSLPEAQVKKQTGNVSGTTDFLYNGARPTVVESDTSPSQYTTYDDTYKLVTASSVDRGDGCVVVTQNTLTADEKGIAQSVVSVGGVEQSRTNYEYDIYGNVSRATLVENNAVISDTYYNYSYNPTDASYYVHVSVGALKDADGNALPNVNTYQYFDTRGRCIKTVDGAGEETLYTFDTLGRALLVTYPDASSMEYEYDLPNNVITVTLPNETTQRHNYTPLGLYDSVELNRGGSWITAYEYEYDSTSRKTVETEYRDYDGTTVTDKYTSAYTYNNKNQIVNQTIRDIAGNTVSDTDYAYENLPEEQVSLWSVPYYITEQGAGATMGEYVYDRCTVRHTLNGAYDYFNLYAYQPSPIYVSSVTVKVVGITYDGEVVQLYNSYGNVLEEKINVKGLMEIYVEVWSGEGGGYYTGTLVKDTEVKRRVTISPNDPAQPMPTIVRSYDGKGNVLSEMLYDANGARKQITKSVYDKANNLTGTWSGAGLSDAYYRAYVYTYNYQNQPTAARNPVGSWTYAAYDARGLAISQTDELNNTTQIAYDAMGREIKITAPFEGSSASETKKYYDANGNMTKTMVRTNAVGSNSASYTQTTFEYDGMNRLTAAIAYPNAYNLNVKNYTQYGYDVMGNVTEVYTGLTAPLNLATETGTDMDFAVTRYSYNDLGQAVGEIDPMEYVSSYTYDLAGNVKTASVKGETQASTTYNLWGSPLTVTSAEIGGGSSETIVRTYNRANMPKTMTDSSGTTSYTYNSLLQLTQEDKNGIISTYNYDSYGNLGSYNLKDANQATVLVQSYGYNHLNQLVTMNAEQKQVQYTYDARGSLKREQTAGYDTLYNYNAAGLLKDKTSKFGSTVLNSTSYAYRVDGNIAAKDDSVGGYEHYSYDGMGRLSYEMAYKYYFQASNYFYDDYGNRTSKSTVNDIRNLGTTQYTYDKNNRLISEFVSDGNGNNASGYYNYDARGNQISAITNQFTPSSQGDPVVSLSGVPESKVSLNQFDALNRLTQADITQGGTNTVATYLYDGNNLRQSKTVDGITTQHLWSGSNIVADVTGNETQTYIRGLGLTYMKDSSGTMSKYVTDGHGDVIALYGMDGAKTQDYRYDAFGNPRTEVVDSNPFRYCGEYTDAETGYVYLRNRYYDPSVGRFITEDPYWNTKNMIYGEVPENTVPDITSIMQSSNLYVYAINNPFIFIDPSGFKIVLSSDATKAQKEAYEKAIAYLKTSKTGKALIEKLENAKDAKGNDIIITITFNNIHDDYYDSSTRTIAWDSTSGLLMSNGTSVQSAALGLAHEMGHGAQHLDGEFDGKTRSEIESDNLKKYETPIAKELGESTRKSYTDNKGTVRMTTSTHYRKTFWGSKGYYTKDYNKILKKK